jgi:DeoR family transcriptional regulator, glycerol-3-phosphate regulon repressor
VRPADRHEKIVRLVHKAGEIGVDELAQTLSASRETIRRDLSNLDAMGRLKKFHGGARVRSTPSVEPAVEGPFALRMAENLTAKRRIAYAAARLLAPGDSVFIDTGTTTLILAEALVDLPALVVITNSWKIAATVSANADHKVFLLGGAYGADAGETLGQFAVEQVRKFRARHAFLTVGAVDQHSVMDFDAQVTEVAQTMIERAELRAGGCFEIRQARHFRGRALVCAGPAGDGTGAAGLDRRGAGGRRDGSRDRLSG